MQTLSSYRRRPARIRGRVARTGIAAATLILITVSLAEARPAPDGFADLVEKVAPAVVNVAVAKQSHPPAMGPRADGASPFPPGSPFDQFFKKFYEEREGRAPHGAPRESGRMVRGLGSGFIVDADGFVVTNNHVVAGAEHIEVKLTDGKTYKARLIGRDERTDLALLKVDADRPLPFVQFGNSDRVRVGDWVLAVGNPFGLGGTVTAGIVSADGRDLPEANLVDFLQIDAPINRGNSGGPSFGLNGEVIGVNTAIFSPNGGSVGIGFAIPSNLAKKIVADLRANGTVSRGWIGVIIQPVTDGIAESLGLTASKGALIASVKDDGPAATAGLRPGDVVLAWDGAAVESLRDLPKLVANAPVGAVAIATVWREGKSIDVSVTPEPLPQPAKAAAANPTATPDGRTRTLEQTGLTVATLDGGTRARLGLTGEVSGILVTDVADDSHAAEAGLRPGDVITAIALRPVASVDEATAQLQAAGETRRTAVLLRVLRGGNDRLVPLRLKKA